jgi:hypothetical protein
LVEDSRKPGENLDQEAIKKESWDLSHELHDIEVSIHEHYHIQAYIARYADIAKRIVEVHRVRSQQRLKLGANLRNLIELGMSEDELYDFLPYVSRDEIKRILTNQP